jgi:hypothetical protein
MAAPPMMQYPMKVSWLKLPQRLNPAQYIAPPVGATVMPEQPYVANEWEANAKAAAVPGAARAADGLLRPVVPPFVAGEGDRTLVHQRNFAATLPAREPLVRRLLPYPIRRAAAMSLLHGGVRTTGLNAPYPDLSVTRSERLTLPTRAEERRDLRWDAADFALHLTPVNVHHEFRMLMWHNRAVDLARRIEREMAACARPVFIDGAARAAGGAASAAAAGRTRANANMASDRIRATGAIVFQPSVRYVQPTAQSLRVEPLSDDAWQRRRADSAEARRLSAPLKPPAHTQRDAFLPFQSIKPHGYGAWSVAQRAGYLRTASMELHQERLNRKGFGWKQMQTKLWQQDMDTERYTPDRGY